MKIFIDADACPVTKEAVEIARMYNIECFIVCDTAHEIKTDYGKVLTVSQGSDSADYKIANTISKGDIAVTQDYGLAAVVLSRSAYAINQDGLVYDENNIDALLLSRYENGKIRRSGGRHKGPKKRTPDKTETFINNLSKLIEKVQQ